MRLSGTARASSLPELPASRSGADRRAPRGTISVRSRPEIYRAGTRDFSIAGDALGVGGVVCGPAVVARAGKSASMGIRPTPTGRWSVPPDTRCTIRPDVPGPRRRSRWGGGPGLPALRDRITGAGLIPSRAAKRRRSTNAPRHPVASARYRRSRKCRRLRKRRMVTVFPITIKRH